LNQLLPALNNQYDYCIIDTAPTYDNLVLNAIQASDMIITPVQLSQFNYKGASFYREKLASETNKIGNWCVLINSFSEHRNMSAESLTSQYLNLFISTFDNILPVTIPKSAYIQKYIDTGETISLTAARKKGLFQALATFTSIVADTDLSNIRRL
jgi:chromosome partitioning protein